MAAVQITASFRYRCPPGTGTPVTRHRPQTKAVRSSPWEAAHCLAICGMFFLPIQIQAMAFSFLAAKN